MHSHPADGLIVRSMIRPLTRTHLAVSLIYKISNHLVYADVAELADAPDLGSGIYDVGVQVPSSAL